MTAPPGEFSAVTDPGALKQAFGCFPSGVVAVCSHAGGPGDPEPIGMAASSFTSVSMDPPLVSVCVQNSSTTWPRLRASRTLGVSVFSADQSDLCRQMAGPAEHRFDGIDPFGPDIAAGAGVDEEALFVPQATAHLLCTVEQEVPAGDHVLVLLRIEALRSDPDIEPLVFHASGFRSLEARR
ncbi:flavin reductase family protein [Gordonia sp. NPDC003376]